MSWKNFRYQNIFRRKFVNNKTIIANELLKTELERTKEKLQNQVEEADNLYTTLDDLEQYTRKNSLQIHGIPDDCYSTTEEVVLKLASVLNVNVNSSDIEISHKIKRRGNNSSPIIVKFISHKVKTSLHKERVNLRSVRYVSQLFQRGESRRNSHLPKTKT